MLQCQHQSMLRQTDRQTDKQRLVVITHVFSHFHLHVLPLKLLHCFRCLLWVHHFTHRRHCLHSRHTTTHRHISLLKPLQLVTFSRHLTCEMLSQVVIYTYTVAYLGCCSHGISHLHIGLHQLKHISTSVSSQVIIIILGMHH